MPMTKDDFYDFAMLMKNDSILLFENQSYHNSVYIGGYTLEAYIKIILIEYDNPDFSNHLGKINLANKLKEIFALYPEYFEKSILIQGNKDYPRYLFNGNGNNNTKSKWNINSRYKIEHWSDENFCSKIQEELVVIEKELVNLKLDGVI